MLRASTTRPLSCLVMGLLLGSGGVLARSVSPDAAGSHPPQPPRAAPASCSTRSASAKFAVRRPRPAARASHRSRPSRFHTRSPPSTRASSPAPTRRSRTMDRRNRSTPGAAITRWPRRCDSRWCGGSSASPRNSGRRASWTTSSGSRTATPIRRAASRPSGLADRSTISPEEQVQFLLRLFANQLPVSEHAMRTVRTVLVQPEGSSSTRLANTRSSARGRQERSSARRPAAGATAAASRCDGSSATSAASTAHGCL